MKYKPLYILLPYAEIRALLTRSLSTPLEYYDNIGDEYASNQARQRALAHLDEYRKAGYRWVRTDGDWTVWELATPGGATSAAPVANEEDSHE
ncbi:MAG: hypothetical protein KC415_22930 [Anaerolineales bacterium]|nr:hypothetical protein [Anaerolineales bacterium]MCB8991823.1 hypothetical protein [Ardenticatenaceae bacterium]